MPSWMRALLPKKPKMTEHTTATNDGHASVGYPSRALTERIRNDGSNNQPLSELASGPTPSSGSLKLTEDNVCAEKHGSLVAKPDSSQQCIPHHFEQEKHGLFILYPPPELSICPPTISAEYVISFSTLRASQD